MRALLAVNTAGYAPVASPVCAADASVRQAQASSAPQDPTQQQRLNPHPDLSGPLTLFASRRSWPLAGSEVP